MSQTIFSILSSRDRLSLPQLIHYSRSSELSPKYVKHGLAVLVDRQLAFHFQSLDDGVTYFEANLQNAYNLTRIGKYVQIARSHPRFGRIGADIVVHFQSLGSTSRTELRERLVCDRVTEESTQRIEPSSGTKGVAETHSGLEDSLEIRKDVLESLFDSRHIILARPDSDYLPPYEFHDQIEFEESRKYPHGPKGKEKKDLARLTLARKRHDRDDNKASYDLMEEIPKVLKDLDNNKSDLDADKILSSDSKSLEKRRGLNNLRSYATLDGAGENDNGEAHDDITESGEQDNFSQSWGLVPTRLPQIDGSSNVQTGVRTTEPTKDASVGRNKSAGSLEAQESAQSEAEAGSMPKAGKATRSSKRPLVEVAEADEPEQLQEVREPGQSSTKAISSADAVKSTRSSKRQRVSAANADQKFIETAEDRKSARSTRNTNKSSTTSGTIPSPKRTPKKAHPQQAADDNGELQNPSMSNGLPMGHVETDKNMKSLKRHRKEANQDLADSVERPTKTLRSTRSKSNSNDTIAAINAAKSKDQRGTESSDAEQPFERPTELRKSTRSSKPQIELASTNGTNKRSKKLENPSKTIADDELLSNGNRGDKMLTHDRNGIVLHGNKGNDSNEASDDSESAQTRLPVEAMVSKGNHHESGPETQDFVDTNGIPLSDGRGATDSQSIERTAVPTSRARKKPGPLAIAETSISETRGKPGNIGKTVDTVNEYSNSTTEQNKDHVAATSEVVNSKEKITGHKERVDGVEDELTEPNEIFFRINPEKFSVSMRSDRLVEMADQYLGAKTSEVFGALLSALDWKILRCYDPYEPNIKEEASEDGGEEDLGIDDDDSDMDDACATTTQRVSIELGKSTGVSGIQEGKNSLQGTKSHAPAVDRSGVDFGGNSSNELPDQVEEHLRLLAQHSHRFVHPVIQDGIQKWEVDFDDLCLILLQQELENVVSARFDQPSARIICFLNALGKLDEKELADRTLIPQKDLRAKLARLHEVGYIDLQEIPRDASRQPSRTIYLWHFNRERCRKLILDDTYKTMARLIRRVAVEKEKVQRTIDKSERTDVVGREDELLSERDKEILQNWRAKEEKLWIQVGRLDDMVAVLRDFLPLHNVI